LASIDRNIDTSQKYRHISRNIGKLKLLEKYRYPYGKILGNIVIDIETPNIAQLRQFWCPLMTLTPLDPNYLG
jgi:hypothetical protein